MRSTKQNLMQCSGTFRMCTKRGQEVMRMEMESPMGSMDKAPTGSYWGLISLKPCKLIHTFLCSRQQKCARYKHFNQSSLHSVANCCSWCYLLCIWAYKNLSLPRGAIAGSPTEYATDAMQYSTSELAKTYFCCIGFNHLWQKYTNCKIT